MTNDFKTTEKCDSVCAHIANGGSLIDLCTLENIRFSDLVMWLNEKPQQKRYVAALTAQTEWAIQKVLTELRTMSFVDRRKIYNNDDTIKPIKDWPDDVAKLIAGIEMDEIGGASGEKIGITKKVKLTDKLKCLNLMMKNMGMLTERTMSLHGTTDDSDFCDEFFGVNKTGE